MNGKNKKTPYAIFLVVICLILAGCSGAPGSAVDSSIPVESTNAVSDPAETTTPTKMEKIKTMAESRGMTMDDLKKKDRKDIRFVMESSSWIYR